MHNLRQDIRRPDEVQTYKIAELIKRLTLNSTIIYIKWPSLQLSFLEMLEKVQPIIRADPPQSSSHRLEALFV